MLGPVSTSVVPASACSVPAPLIDPVTVSVPVLTSMRPALDTESCTVPNPKNFAPLVTLSELVWNVPPPSCTMPLSVKFRPLV